MTLWLTDWLNLQQISHFCSFSPKYILLDIVLCLKVNSDSTHHKQKDHMIINYKLFVNTPQHLAWSESRGDLSQGTRIGEKTGQGLYPHGRGPNPENLQGHQNSIFSPPPQNSVMLPMQAQQNCHIMCGCQYPTKSENLAKALGPVFC